MSIELRAISRDFALDFIWGGSTISYVHPPTKLHSIGEHKNAGARYNSIDGSICENLRLV